MVAKNSFLNGIYYKFIKNPKNNHTLVFLHGFTGNSSIWEEIIIELKKRYSILILDLVGHGKSYSPQKIEEYSFENQTEKIIDILRKLKINSISIISYSYSCYLGLLIANKLGAKTKNLIFISPYFKERYNLLEKRVADIMKFIWKYLVKDKKHDLDYSLIENYENPKFKDTKYTLKSINTKDVIGSICSFVKFGKIPKLNKKDMPLLVIYGEKDKMFTKDVSSIFEKKNTELKVMKGKKHLFLKTKSRVIAEAIKLFLIKNS